MAVASIVSWSSGQPAVAQDINLATGGADQTWRGTQPNAAAGLWLDQGAVSNDSRRDLIVGSPGTASIAGAVYVLFGGPVRSGDFVLSAAETVITSSEAGNLFGAATAVGNILNAEGTTPRALVVGAPGALGGRGIVYLFAGGFTTPINNSDPARFKTTADAVFRIVGANGDRLGTAIATGDLDNDGFREIIIGAPGNARVYIVRGGPSLSGTLDLSTTSAAATITSAGIGGVLTAGDITNDNIADLLIGAPSSNLAFMFTGSNGTIPTAAVGSFFGIDADDRAGTAFRIGDFDGDGKRDLVITAPRGDGPNNDRANAGEAYLFWGPVATGPRSLAAANVMFHGAAANMRTGTELTAGDINRDTPNDLVLLSPGNSSGAGQLEIFYGRGRGSFGVLQPDGRRVADFAAAGHVSRRIFGDPAVSPIISAQVFEVTGEGARDIIVGVPGAESGAGKLYFTISPKLRINPTTLSVFVNENNSATIPTPINIMNPSTVFIGWEATANRTWLSMSPSVGSADHTHPAVLYVVGSAQGVAPGVHTGRVTIESTSPDLEMALGVDVTMTVTGVRMALDTPVHGVEVGTTFNVAGWAVDVASTSGTGISLVEIWAYPNPGSGTAPVLIGAANYGGSRPDVGSLYGSRFTNSGFNLSVSSLAPGRYQIAAFAKSSVSNAFMLSRTAVVEVVTGTPNPIPDPNPGPNPNPGPTPDPDPDPIPGPGPGPAPGPGPDTRVSLNRTGLNFGAIAGTNRPRTTAQQFTVGFTNGTASWTATTSAPWLELSPASGTGVATVNATVKAGSYAQGTFSGNIVVTAPGVPNSPVSIPVTLRVYAAAEDPIGVIETPRNNATGVVGAIPVTGWALDAIGIKDVTVWRDPIPGEGSSSVNGKIFIGRATKVDGARPDVNTIYDHPFDYIAGWGYMLLTNMLPNQGNGTFTLYIFAEDLEGRSVSLGARTIVCTNANAKKPFGTIDTPDQGGSVSGTTYTNFGWALTPAPNAIPTDGSTIMVFIDGVPVGRPVYNNSRSDIATLFPGRANSNGAIGYYQFDTTRLANGVHTIAWSVSDNAGNAEGIGSRYFTVLNGAVTSALTVDAAASVQAAAGGTPETRTAAASTGELAGATAATLDAVPVSDVPVYTRTGFDPGASLDLVETNERGVAQVTAMEASRFEVTLGAPVADGAGGYEGYLVADGRLQPLPIGAFLDRQTGEFFWQPGVGFVGTYDLLFVRSADGMRERIPVQVTISPRAASSGQERGRIER